MVDVSCLCCEYIHQFRRLDSPENCPVFAVTPDVRRAQPWVGDSVRKRMIRKNAIDLVKVRTELVGKEGR